MTTTQKRRIYSLFLRWVLAICVLFVSYIAPSNLDVSFVAVDESSSLSGNLRAPAATSTSPMRFKGMGQNLLHLPSRLREKWFLVSRLLLIPALHHASSPTAPKKTKQFKCLLLGCRLEEVRMDGSAHQRGILKTITLVARRHILNALSSQCSPRQRAHTQSLETEASALCCPKSLV